jgi:hypothetical protein
MLQIPQDLEDSIALQRLANFLHPANFLIWKQKWSSNNPSGVREGLIGDNDIFEDHIFSEKDDFAIRLQSILKELMDELTKAKITDVKQIPANHTAYCNIGLRLQSILENAQASNVMDKYVDIVAAQLRFLDEDVQTTLNLDLAFSGAVPVGAECVSHIPTKTLDLIFIDSELTREKEAALDHARERNEKFKYLADPKRVVRKCMAFLDPNNGNARSNLSLEQYNELIEVLDKMFEDQCQVDPKYDFRHAIRGIVKRAIIIEAFGDMQEILLEEQRPSWYVPSMKSLFRLNGDVINLNKKLKGAKQIERLRGRQKTLFPED